MIAPRLRGARPDDDLDARLAQPREAPARRRAGPGPRSPQTTRATPAATIASAQGGVTP